MGQCLQLEYEKGWKKGKHQYSIAQDWVKYPAKEPTKYLKADWAPFCAIYQGQAEVHEVKLGKVYAVGVGPGFSEIRDRGLSGR